MLSKTKLFAFLLLLVGTGFIITLSTTIETTFTDFSMNDTLELDVQKEQSYYLLYKGGVDSDFFDVSQSTIYSVIEFPSYLGDIAFFANVRHTDTNERYYLDGFGENSSIKINDMNALGTYHLEEGQYHITITSASSETLVIEDEFEFTIIPTSFMSNLGFTIILGLATVACLILFLVFYSKGRKQMDIDSTFDGHTYKQQSPQELFDMDNDDIFDTYDKRR